MRRVAVPVVLDVVGSAAVLILVALSWQRVQVVRQPPFADITVGLSGRTVAPAVFGLALVTLAGGVAALATRGLARRVVGVVVTVAGVLTAVAAVFALHAPGDGRARTLAAQAVADRTSGAAVVPVTDGAVTVVVHGVWPVLAGVAALLTVVAGVLWLLPNARGGAASGATGGGGLGPRYEAPVATERPRDATMWSALDHGEDPTADRPDATTTSGEHDADTDAGRPSA